MIRLLLFILLAGIFQINTRAQQERVTGKIIDKRTRRPLAFVSIVYKESGQGTVSDLDGEFSIPAGVDFLKFSYLGYQSRFIPAEEIVPGTMLDVRLEQIVYEIEEVQIQPALNPAHRIIRLASQNRKFNNPEMMQSFSYTSYSKMFFTLDLDSMYRDAVNTGPIEDVSKTDGTGHEPDSTFMKLEEFLEEKHLFLMEFISTREFMHPDKNRERVTASRVSGFSDPSFTLLASQIQSFSFYEDLFIIWDKKYLNPISRGSIRKYLFILEDTLYTEAQDTLFVISYRPLRNRNFDGLKGTLYINSKGYAIQNVIAEAAETQGFFRIRIQQQYEFIDHRQWFPVQLNTDIMLSSDALKANDAPVALLGIGKSYLSDIMLDPPLRRRDFDHIELLVEKEARKQDETYWDRYRAMPLTKKDTSTYIFIDSIGEEAHLDRKMKNLETFASGYIPVKFLNLDYRSFVKWNRFEGFRFGLAAETNQELSKWFSLGGKAAYGIRDRQFKYGGHLRVNLNRRADAFMQLYYNHDVTESAGFEFIDKPPVTSSEYFRSFLIASKDIVEEKEVSLQIPLIRYMRIRGYINRNFRQVTGDYRYTMIRDNEAFEQDRFNFSTAGFQLRYAHRESFLETPRGNRISLGTDYPVIQANISFGIPSLGGEFEYTRMEARISKTFISKSLGEAKITLIGGRVDRNVPYPLLYAGQGSYGNFTIESENSFATMRLNEFVADHFASIHFQQDFGKLLFKHEKFQPGVVLASSAGYGKLNFRQNHVNLPGDDYEKGYFESGILFNNLLRQWIIGYGLGVFYRYGAYSLPKTIDNFAFKFTVRFNL